MYGADLSKSQLRSLNEIIFKYFPGVWVYFLGKDFDVHYDIYINALDSIDSTNTGETLFLGNSFLKLKMTSDTVIPFTNATEELTLMFATSNSRCNVTMEFYTKKNGQIRARF